jgi:hypothetical protein
MTPLSLFATNSLGTVDEITGLGRTMLERFARTSPG